MRINSQTMSSQNKPTETSRDRNPENGDVDHFTSLMSDKKKKPQTKGTKEEQMSDSSFGKKGGEEEQNFTSAADAILKSMGNSSVEKGVGQQAAGKTEQLGNVVDEIVDRILVSESDEAGKQEVRISLKSSRALPDTEIRISREGSTVNVELVSKDNATKHEIARHVDGLKSQLEDRLDTNVSVRATSGDNETDSNGRSRQQRNLYDELND